MLEKPITVYSISEYRCWKYFFKLKWKMAMSTDLKKKKKKVIPGHWRLAVFNPFFFFFLFCLISHTGHVFQLLSTGSEDKVWGKNFQL